MSQKIVGYKQERGTMNFEPIYEEIPDKTNNMNLSMIDTNTWEGRMLIAATSQLSGHGKFASMVPDQILEEMDGIVNHIYKDNPLPKSEEYVRPTFEKALESLINQYSKENDNDTPDFILANYMNDCLNAYTKAVLHRDTWFAVDMWTDDKRSKRVK